MQVLYALIFTNDYSSHFVARCGGFFICLINLFFTGDKEEVVVIIPDTIDSIAQGAYSCCRELVAVSIPISVTYIDKWAFWGCKSLTTIEYEGTIDQWNNITKGKNWCEGVKECYVECADGEIELQ